MKKTKLPKLLLKVETIKMLGPCLLMDVVGGQRPSRGQTDCPINTTKVNGCGG